MGSTRPCCDICGSNSCLEQALLCANGSAGCPSARHLWCFDDHTLTKLPDEKTFLCLHCSDHPPPRLSSSDCNAERKLREGSGTESMKEAAARKSEKQDGATIADEPVASSSRGPEGVEGEKGGGAQFTFAAKEGERNGTSERSKGQKRPSSTSLVGSKPSKARLEVPQPAAQPPVNFLDQVMRGQAQERERQEQQRKRLAVRQELQAVGGGASESASEQRLKRGQRNLPRDLTPELLDRQRRTIAASIKEKPIWSGQLLLQLSEEKEEFLAVDLRAYCMAGNAHAMDASLKLPKHELRGILVDSKDTLDMTVAEAADYASLIFKASDPDSDRQFTRVIKDHLSNTKLLQVELGDNKPLWVAFLPGPAMSGCCLAAFVRYDEEWRHSKKDPGKGLLQKERRGRKRKLGWPDHQRVDRKSADLERDRGPEYGHLRLDRAQAEPPDQVAGVDPPEPSNFEVEEFQRLPAKPLAGFSVALVGFDKHHAEIVNLRKLLNRNGASTFLNPWPGCCQVLVLPEQLINKDLSLEIHAPKELQPIRDFLLAGARVFSRIDYPRLCCHYGRSLTREEELKHKIKDVWPEGAVFVGDAATLHAAGTTPHPGGDGTRTVLDELLRELNSAAAAAKVSGSVWQVMAAPHHLDELRGWAQGNGSPALAVLEKWRSCNRFAPMDPAMATPDLIHNAMKLAQFYRYFCRYTVVLARSSDTGLIAAVEARKMIHCVTVEEAPTFLRENLKRHDSPRAPVNGSK